MPQGILADAENKFYCTKCRKTMASSNFYTYKDGSKCELCKSCLTMHINNWEPDTFTWLLEKFDVPYIPSEWNILRDRAFQKDPYKMTGMSVFGKYLSKMKLKQWKNFNWADTERLQAEAEEKARLYGAEKEQVEKKIEEMKQALDNGEISEAQYQTYAEINAPEPAAPEPLPPQMNDSSAAAYPVNDHPFEKIDLPDVGADLTSEDKIYLAIKWGRLYSAEEWVSLEKLYEEFMNTFDIQGAARIDTLKMICKTSLKMNQAIDCGDIETYQKLSRVYDSMMKAAKFTEAQRKEEKSGDFDAVGQIVYFAEKEGGKIPRHEITTPLDIVDKAINNLKKYNHDLVINDPTLSQMFENLVKRRESVMDQKADLKKAQAEGLDYVPIEDKDYIEYSDFITEEKEKDKKLLDAGSEVEEK